MVLTRTLLGKNARTVALERNPQVLRNDLRRCYTESL
jgi:hypothetical protein